MAKKRGRPPEFDRALAMAKMAWSPVLEMLGNPELERMDRLRYKPEPFLFAVGTRLIDAERAHARDPESFRWLTVSEVIRIHDRMILTFGGELGVLDEGKIASAIDRARYSTVFGADPFPTIIHKAASMMHDILVYHPFADGQKRTGISAAFIFLGLNGFSLWSRDPLDEVHFAIRVAKGEYETEQIASWLERRIAPPSRLGESETGLLIRHLPPSVRRCHVCQRYLALRAYRIRCRNCATSYRVLIRYGTVTTTRAGRRRFKATLGLVKEATPAPMTIHVGAKGRALLLRPVRGEGGWNSLLRTLQNKMGRGGRLDLTPDEILRVRGYAEHHGVGGFQSRLAPVLEALRRAEAKWS